jgi:hypothetical protein
MLTAGMSRFDPKPTSFDLDQQTALAMVRSGVVPASEAGSRRTVCHLSKERS